MVLATLVLSPLLFLFSATTRTRTDFECSTIRPLEKDVNVHQWCEKVGIDVDPKIQLATTDLSVGGRGVFATDTIEKGDVLVKIPFYCVLAPSIAGRSFPDVEEELLESSRRYHLYQKSYGKKRYVLQKILQRISSLLRIGHKHGSSKGELEAKYWHIQLTAYALAAVDSDNSIWTEWINEWQRDDPMSRLFESDVTSADIDIISQTATELNEMVPELSHQHTEAALHIRLQRFEEEEKFFWSKHSRNRKRNTTKTSSDSLARRKMYSVLGSRACDLGDDIVGVVPYYDMINHSLDPNMEFQINGETDNFELYSSRRIEEGEELFICYHSKQVLDQKGFDSLNSLWTLIQWVSLPLLFFCTSKQDKATRHSSILFLIFISQGIPISTKDANAQLAEINKRSKGDTSEE